MVAKINLPLFSINKAYLLTAKDRQKIIKLYKEGYSCVYIHKKLKIPEDKVYSFVRELIGLKTQTERNNERKYILNKDEKENIRNMYFRVDSTNELITHFDIPKYVIFEYIEINNLYREKILYKKQTLTPIIQNMYLNKKMSITQIVKMKIASEPYIRSILKELNILRTFEESMDNFNKIKNSTFKNIDFFETIDTEEKAYWLGFIYADGNINKDLNTLAIGLKHTDKGHLDKFANLFDIEVKLYKQKAYKTIPERTTASLRVCNSMFVSHLLNKGILPRKTYINSNETFNHVPKELLRHFIRGFFDGDGCKAKYSLSFICASYLFLDSVKENLNNITNAKKQLHSRKTFYTLSYSKTESKVIKKYFYENSNIFLERKYLKFD